MSEEFEEDESVYKVFKRISTHYKTKSMSAEDRKKAIKREWDKYLRDKIKKENEEWYISQKNLKVNKAMHKEELKKYISEQEEKFKKTTMEDFI